MIVQCPQCESQYRVQDDKIPASGGKISCPNCSNRFVVHPDDNSSQSPGQPAGGSRGGGGGSDYREEKTSAVNANRLAQMAEGMEGEDVDEPDAGEVDKTEVMQGPNVPDFMAGDQQGGEAGGEADEGTREMRNPFAGGEQGAGGGHADDTTTDVSKDELMGDIEDATEVWDGVDAIQEMHGEGGEEGPSLQSHEGNSAGAQGRGGEPAGGQPADQSGGVRVDRGQSGGQQQGGARDSGVQPPDQAPADDSAPVDPSQGTRQQPSRQQGGGGGSHGQPRDSGPSRTVETNRQDVQQSARSPEDASAGGAPPPPSGGGQPEGGASQGPPSGQSGSQPARGAGQSGSQPTRGAGQSGSQPARGGGQSAPSGQSGSQPTRGGGQSAPSSQSGSQPAIGGGQSSPPSPPASQGAGGQPGGGASPAGGGPAPGHEGPWKLRAEHGLTYEFPETEALRDWLRDRDEIENFDLSADDGDSFYGLGEFPQVADLVGGGADASGSQQMAARGGGGQPRGRGQQSQSGGRGGNRGAPPGGGGRADAGNRGAPAGRGGQPSGAASSGGQSPPVPNDGPSWDDALGSESSEPMGSEDDGEPEPKPVENDGFELPSRDAVWNKVLYAIVFVLLVAAVGLALEIAKVYPVAKYVPGVPSTFDDGQSATAGLGGTGSGTANPGGERAAPAGGEDSDEEGGGEAFDRLMEAADDSIENKRLQTAIEKLQGAKMVDPERPEIYERLAEVYKKLGQDEKAEKNRQKANELAGDGEASADGEKGEADEKPDEPKDDEANPTN